MSGHNPWSQIRYKGLVHPDRPWKTIREGSNFEVPVFPSIEILGPFPLATGKSKKLYEAAVGRAFYNTCASPLGLYHAGIRFDWRFSTVADDRLYQRAYS
jgi:hypothetical protein